MRQNLQQKMNNSLQKIFSAWYHPSLTNNKVDGASSVAGTSELRDQIVQLFEKYNVKSIFDAGCNDCNWMKIIEEYVEYHGGDISIGMVADVWMNYPELDVVLHDITTDPIPAVDLLFVRDVAIHLNDQDRLLLWKNWFSSNVPWMLITHNPDSDTNQDVQYVIGKFPFSPVNWKLPPWNFPAPIDAVNEYSPNGRCIALWHRDQFKNIL